MAEEKPAEQPAETNPFETAEQAWEFVHNNAGEPDVEGRARTFVLAVARLKTLRAIDFSLSQDLLNARNRALNAAEQMLENNLTIKATAEMIVRQAWFAGGPQAIAESVAIVGPIVDGLKRVADTNADLVKSYWGSVATVRLIVQREQ